ncbi:MAG: transporter, family, inner rane transport protein [Alphaproteobacteria bacterium]|nr:transporter, family, inner rane transport protein [Alphaproteobacteria bacterium]
MRVGVTRGSTMAIDRKSTNSRALLALAVASFGIGTTEFVIMGLLPNVAHDLGVTIPQAGLLVSGYALGVVFGAPILAIATARIDRRRALLLLIGIFILGNCLCAIAPSYALLMGARIVTAFSHGAFFGLGAVVAANVVAPQKRAQAIALMFTGLALANVLGVPFGTALGQAAGWRMTFWAVVAIGIVAALALYAWLPRGITSNGAGLLQETRTLVRRQVLLAMLISVLASASLFSVFTYITPILENVTRESPHHVTWMLLLFGVGLTFGNFLGGRLGDWRLMPSVIAIFILLIGVLGVLTVTSHIAWLAGTTIFVWGVLAFALVSPLQMQVVNEASGAPNLASTLNQGAFNLGNAAGAFAGELALTDGVSYGNIPWIGVGLAALGLAFSLLSHRLDRRAPDTGHAGPSISAQQV